VGNPPPKPQHPRSFSYRDFFRLFSGFWRPPNLQFFLFPISRGCFTPPTCLGFLFGQGLPLTPKDPLLGPQAQIQTSVPLCVGFPFYLYSPLQTTSRFLPLPILFYPARMQPISAAIPFNENSMSPDRGAPKPTLRVLDCSDPFLFSASLASSLRIPRPRFGLFFGVWFLQAFPSMTLTSFFTFFFSSRFPPFVVPAVFCFSVLVPPPDPQMLA